jgi:hypothetical protein
MYVWLLLYTVIILHLVETQTTAFHISFFLFVLPGPIVDVEECEDYVVDEDRMSEDANKVSEAVEPNENQPEISDETSQDVGGANGRGVFYDHIFIFI